MAQPTFSIRRFICGICTAAFMAVTVGYAAAEAPIHHHTPSASASRAASSTASLSAQDRETLKTLLTIEIKTLPIPSAGQKLGDFLGNMSEKKRLTALGEIKKIIMGMDAHAVDSKGAYVVCTANTVLQFAVKFGAARTAQGIAFFSDAVRSSASRIDEAVIKKMKVEANYSIYKRPPDRPVTAEERAQRHAQYESDHKAVEWGSIAKIIGGAALAVLAALYWWFHLQEGKLRHQEE